MSKSDRIFLAIALIVGTPLGVFVGVSMWPLFLIIGFPIIVVLIFGWKSLLEGDNNNIKNNDGKGVPYSKNGKLEPNCDKKQCPYCKKTSRMTAPPSTFYAECPNCGEDVYIGP